VEDQIEKIIRVFKTDVGVELCGNEFIQLFNKCGIVRKNNTS
jgi:hypothetical protein